MAKQIGAMPISGKIDNLVYYNTKNGGAVVRRAYPNLGKRVKTDKVYANTRRNNAEFGMCGYVASQLLAPILQKWKYILKPDAVGELTKFLIKFLPLSVNKNWGQRNLIVDDNILTTKIQNYVTSLCKNEDNGVMYNALLQGFVELSYDDSYVRILIDGVKLLDELTIEKYRSIGANSINLYVGILSIDYPVVNNETQTFFYRTRKSIISNPQNFIIPDESNFIEFYFSTDFNDAGFYPYADDNYICGGIIICTIPVKNNEELVEFGTFAYYTATW